MAGSTDGGQVLILIAAEVVDVVDLGCAPHAHALDLQVASPLVAPQDALSGLAPSARPAATGRPFDRRMGGTPGGSGG